MNSKNFDTKNQTNEIELLIKKYPNAPLIYNLRGAVLAEQNNLDEAIVNYKKSIQIKPDYASAYNN